MPVGAQAQIDRAAAIVEVAWVNWIKKPIRTIGGGIGEESELLCEAAAKSRRNIACAKVAGTHTQTPIDIFINAGFRLDDDDGGVAPAEFSRDVSGDHLNCVDRVGVERTGRNRVQPVGDGNSIYHVQRPIIHSTNV